MEQTQNLMSFEEWAKAVDVLCRRYFACSWDDLAGDLEPLQGSYENRETPRQFIEGMARKFDLTWTDSVLFLPRDQLGR